ncbi:hypothetical protein [Ornithinimicrobium kibberense]|uniref:hypothetical protein n=1 Tax=Ornithinimicrobium kibberense TaxID=282060 RepID=UPI00361009D9
MSCRTCRSPKCLFTSVRTTSGAPGARPAGEGVSVMSGTLTAGDLRRHRLRRQCHRLVTLGGPGRA